MAVRCARGCVPAWPRCVDNLGAAQAGAMAGWRADPTPPSPPSPQAKAARAAALELASVRFDVVAAADDDAATAAPFEDGGRDSAAPPTCGVCLQALSSQLGGEAAADDHVGQAAALELFLFCSFVTAAAAAPVAECRRLLCGHEYHRACIDRWLVECGQQLCPMCRQPAYSTDQ